MTSQYFLTIENETQGIGNGGMKAFAFGDLAEVSFIAKRRLPDMTGSTDTYQVLLVEIEPSEIGHLTDDTEPPQAAVKRSVTAFTGDGDTAAVVLKRKLAAERKQEADAAGPGPEDVQELRDTEQAAHADTH